MWQMVSISTVFKELPLKKRTTFCLKTVIHTNISSLVVCGYATYAYLALIQSEANPEAENQVVGAESQQNEVRVQYTDAGQSAQQVYSDQEEAASGGGQTVTDILF
jgi:hypothetical protein